MVKKKPLKKPKKNVQLAVGNMYYNLVRYDATLLNKIIKWAILIHYPAYIITLIYELITVDYVQNGYVGPASMIFPMSLTGSIIFEIVYFLTMTVVTLQLYTSMKSYKELQLSKHIKSQNKKRGEFK